MWNESDIWRHIIRIISNAFSFEYEWNGLHIIWLKYPFISPIAWKAWMFSQRNQNNIFCICYKESACHSLVRSDNIKPLKYSYRRETVTIKKVKHFCRNAITVRDDIYIQFHAILPCARKQFRRKWTLCRVYRSYRWHIICVTQQWQ